MRSLAGIQGSIRSMERKACLDKSRAQFNMVYSDFTSLSKFRTTFNLTIDETTRLFPDVFPIEPSDYLKTTLNEFLPLANVINTEKARSELIIAPVLLEVRRYLNFKIGFFSGTDFNVYPTVGLSGYCDYILTDFQEMYEIYGPVVTLVEAKNENIKSGLGKCIAEWWQPSVSSRKRKLQLMLSTEL